MNNFEIVKMCGEKLLAINLFFMVPIYLIFLLLMSFCWFLYVMVFSKLSLKYEQYAKGVYDEE